MTFTEILLQFGTVFLGAFLAFLLENLRERRQLKAWANTYLKIERNSLNSTSTLQFVDELQNIVKAHDDLIRLKRTSDSFWKPLMAYAVTSSKSYSPLIDSAAITTLPVEIGRQLNSLEYHQRTDEQLAIICFDTRQQYTVPVLLDEHALSVKEVNGLNYARETFGNRVTWLKKGLELERELLELLDRHNLGR